MLTKEPDDARVEVAVKGRSVEGGRIGTKARQVRRELRRARRQKSEMAGRHDMNVRLARQAARNARGARRIHACASQFSSPELERDFNDSQIVLGESDTRRIGNHGSPDTSVVRRVRRSFGRSSRQAFINDLQYWNDSLSLCFEKRELPLGSDVPSSALEAIRSRFSAQTCEAVRRHARQVHAAVSRSWNCRAQDHRGNLRLSWHTDSSPPDPAKLRLALCLSSVPNPSVESWRDLLFDVVGEAAGDERNDSNDNRNDKSSSTLSSSSPLRPPPAPSPATDSAPVVPRPRKKLRTWFQPQSVDVEMKDAGEVKPGTSNPGSFDTEMRA